ncbi:MAG: reverse transcriptase/maturase family protein, partial [Patescibacteria group bacterium]
MKVQLAHKFEEIISLENLLLAWPEFVLGKKNRADVRLFARDLMDNIISLHQDLASQNYRHGGYESFFVTDPKRRHIHKASVRDRLLHHAVYRILYPFFDRTFTVDSFSCRLDKGTHKAINQFQTMANKVSRNQTVTCWVLKGDIKKFFASIDHKILLDILDEYIPDKDIMGLLREIVGSFEGKPGVGFPLGNLTSQIFANVYLNIFDQWVKHRLKAEQYIRYADDFVILAPDKELLVSFVPSIKQFLAERL